MSVFVFLQYTLVLNKLLLRISRASKIKFRFLFQFQWLILCLYDNLKKKKTLK